MKPNLLRLESTHKSELDLKYKYYSSNTLLLPLPLLPNADNSGQTHNPLKGPSTHLTEGSCPCPCRASPPPPARRVPEINQPDGGWPELLPFLFQCVTSENHRLQESALLIFAQSSQYIGETLVPHLTMLHSVFLPCLGSSANSDVRIALLRAAINFIQCLPIAADRDRF
ncbi:hypothetical protein L1049_027333 [Liquidambar formosana]|uniref:IPO4/5-like TPR repeats domain-containing protein n=1 Tax=Liquidambar formosana TaxID=63359 RepID=A0AAP0R2F0_LIQFO